jgi:hypothetical protein
LADNNNLHVVGTIYIIERIGAPERRCNQMMAAAAEEEENETGKKKKSFSYI